MNWAFPLFLFHIPVWFAPEQPGFLEIFIACPIRRSVFVGLYMWYNARSGVLLLSVVFPLLLSLFVFVHSF